MSGRRAAAFAFLQVLPAGSNTIATGRMYGTHPRPLPAPERTFLHWFLGFLVGV